MSFWELSCRDWEARLRTGQSLVPELPYLDLATGNRAVIAFNKLRLADVPMTPTLEDGCGDWFRDIVRALFGSYDRATRRRMIREIFALVAKKNSKTTYGALLMLVALLLNERPRAPFIMTAPVQDTAQMAFDAAAGAIALDPVLDKKLHVRQHLKTIVHRETKAELEIMTFDPAVVTGKKVVGALIDELHVIAKMAKASSALRQLRGGMLPFPEAFLIFITTQSDEEPTGIFKAELAKARSIRDGELRNTTTLPILYEFPLAMQRDEEIWKDPANWPMVTPNAGRSIDIPRLVEGFEDANGKGIEELRGWASQHLNIQIGIAMQGDGWIGGLFWEAQVEETLRELDELLRRCDVITVGADGGGLDDMLGLAVMGRERGTGNWLLWVHAWIHPIVLQRRKSEAARFEDLSRDGDLTIVENVGDDIDHVVAIVRRIEEAALLDRVGVDPAGVAEIVEALTNPQGLALDMKERIVGIPQGWRLSGVIKSVERKLADGTLMHGGTSLMNWCVGNAKPENKGNATLITKQQAGTAKIDPLMAAFDAAALMLMNPQPRQKQYQAFFV